MARETNDTAHRLSRLNKPIMMAGGLALSPTTPFRPASTMADVDAAAAAADDASSDDASAAPTSARRSPRAIMLDISARFDGVGMSSDPERYVELVAPEGIELGDFDARAASFGNPKTSGCGLVDRGFLRELILELCSPGDYSDAWPGIMNTGVGRDTIELWQPYRVQHAISDLQAIGQRCQAWRPVSGTLTNGARIVDVGDGADGSGMSERAARALRCFFRPAGAPFVPGDIFLLEGPEHVAVAVDVQLVPPSPSELKSGTKLWKVKSIDGGQRDESGAQCIKQRSRIFSTNVKGEWYAVANDGGSGGSRPCYAVFDLDAFAHTITGAST